MKYYILSALLVCSFTFSQGKFNLSDPNPFIGKTNFTVSEDKPISLQFDNYNPFLYKIEVTSSQRDYNLTMTDHFKNSFNVLVPSEGENKSLDNANYNQFKDFLKVYNKFVTLYNRIQMVVHEDRKFDEIDKNVQLVIESSDIEGLSRDNAFEQCQKSVDDLRSLYSTIQEEYAMNSEKSNSEGLKGLVDSNMEILRTDKFEELPYELHRLVKKITRKNFTFYSEVIEPEKDQITYIVKIDPVEDENTKKFGSVTRSIKHSFNIEVLNGFKIDFSAGLFVSNLIDHKYVVLDDSIYGGTDTALIGSRLMRNKEGDYRLGLGSMGHAYFRWSKYVNMGINFGVGIMQDQNVNYLFGGSLMFGKEQRLILNGGLTGGYVNRLSDLLEENKFYSKLPIQDDIYVKSFQFGWYAGISYNLTN